MTSVPPPGEMLAARPSDVKSTFATTRGGAPDSGTRYTCADPPLGVPLTMRCFPSGCQSRPDSGLAAANESGIVRRSPVFVDTTVMAFRGRVPDVTAGQAIHWRSG